MANITLTGTLRDPNGDLAVGDKVRFTHKSTTGETVKSASSILTIDPTGVYSVDLEYGLILVEYKDARNAHFENLGVATVNGTNPATTIPELLNALVPVSSAELIEFQAILADCVTAKDAAEAAAATLDLISDLSQAYIFDTVALFKSSAIVFPDGKRIEWLGYYAKFDGGSNWGVVTSGVHTDDGGSIFTLADGKYVKANLTGKKVNVMKFGGTSASYAALAATGKNIYTPSGVFTISDNIILQDGQTFTGEGDSSVINLSATISPGMKVNGGGYIAASATSVYYKDEPSVSAGWTRQQITVDATEDSTSLTLNTVTGLVVGDYISVSNGYCDMWRMLETSGQEFQKIINPTVDLWKNAIHQIKNITGNVITINEPLGFDCPAIPKTYGFLADENNLPNYAGYNVPKVEKLIGSVGNLISKVKIINDTTRTIIGYTNRDTTISDVNITHEANSNKPIELYTSLDAKVTNNRVRALGFSYSIRRSSRGCIMTNNTAEYGGVGDGPALIWENAYSCQSNGFTCSTYGGPHGATKIGFYLNTCHSNTVSGVVANGFGRATHIGFGGEGCVITNVTGFGCDVAFGAFASRDFICSNGAVEGQLTATGNQFVDSVIVATSCYRGAFSNVKQSPLIDPAEFSGRVHLASSFGLTFDNVKAPNAWLHASTEDDLTSDIGVPVAVTDKCNFHSFNITTPSFDQPYTRPAILNRTKLNYASKVSKTHYVEFNQCELLGTLTVDDAPYTKLRGTKISDDVSAIDFGTDAADTGRFRSSMIDIDDCQFDAPSNFRYYANPENAITGGSIPNYSLGGGVITLIDQYPLTRKYKNPGEAGNTAGWLVISESPSYV